MGVKNMKKAQDCTEMKEHPQTRQSPDRKAQFYKEFSSDFTN